jgi:hypothetical protein
MAPDEPPVSATAALPTMSMPCATPSSSSVVPVVVVVVFDCYISTSCHLLLLPSSSSVFPIVVVVIFDCCIRNCHPIARRRNRNRRPRRCRPPPPPPLSCCARPSSSSSSSLVLLRAPARSGRYHDGPVACAVRLLGAATGHATTMARPLDGSRTSSRPPPPPPPPLPWSFVAAAVRRSDDEEITRLIKLGCVRRRR